LIEEGKATKSAKKIKEQTWAAKWVQIEKNTMHTTEDESKQQTLAKLTEMNEIEK